MTSIDRIKKLRQETGISLIECKKALEISQGNLEKALEILKKQGVKFAAKKKKRKVGAGIIESYIHSNKRVGVLLDIRCETDFVAQNEEFQRLAHELCLQIAAMSPESKDSFLTQPFIKNPDRVIREIINEHIVKLGENIVIEKFLRYEI